MVRRTSLCSIDEQLYSVEIFDLLEKGCNFLSVIWSAYHGKMLVVLCV